MSRLSRPRGGRGRRRERRGLGPGRAGRAHPHRRDKWSDHGADQGSGDRPHRPRGGDGSVWATDPYQGTLWRIDPGTRVFQRTIDVGAGADSVAFGSGSAWVANSLQGTLSRVDAATNRVVRTIPLGSTPRAVALGEGLVWVAVAGEGTVGAARPQVGQTVQALPATICGPLVSGSEPAKFIVVSDLPLRGGPRFVGPQMSAAILHVLRAHSFAPAATRSASSPATTRRRRGTLR